MIRVYVFVEGPTDAAMLRRILPQYLLVDTELWNAGGRHGIPSLARSVLVRRKRPIAVVIDADSLNTSMIEEQQQSIEDLIRAADASIPVKVVSAIPEIEAWFFAAPEAIERIVGRPVSAELISLGKRDPKGVLRQLLGPGKQLDVLHAINSLDAQDIERMRAIPEVAELTAFLCSLQIQEPVA